MHETLVGNAVEGFEWRGHHCRLLDQKALAAFERKVFSNHFKALQDLREMVTDEQYERQLSEVRNAKASGAYALLGRHGQAWLQTAEGVTFVVALIVDFDKQGVDCWALILEDPKGAKEMIEQVMRDSGIAPAGVADARPF